MGDDVDELSNMKDASKTLDERLNWVAFKNQFFSSVMICDAGLDKAKLTSKMETQGSGYIKDYSAEMNTPFDPTGEEPTNIYFYFGYSFQDRYRTPLIQYRP